MTFVSKIALLPQASLLNASSLVTKKKQNLKLKPV